MSDNTQAENISAGGSITPSKGTVIRVLGVGGGGGNALNHMIDKNLDGVEFIAVNTDSQALKKSKSPLKVQIGVKLTNGLGAGCDPNVGRKATEESRNDIKKLLQGSDMVFITASMGGGTGTGASPVIAQIAKEIGALTVAVVTKPFQFEGKRHMVNAESGISELSKHVDSLIVIDNDKLLKNLGANISIIQGFNAANEVLYNAVSGITDSITHTGFINLDFADVVTIMRGRGHAMIGNGVGRGPNFVQDAVEKAIHSPLIEQVDIATATGLLANIKLNPNFPICKFQEVCDCIQAYADEEADCKYGLVFDENVDEDTISITILITGISATDTNIPANIAKNRLQRLDAKERAEYGLIGNKSPLSMREGYEQTNIKPVMPSRPASLASSAMNVSEAPSMPSFEPAQKEPELPKFAQNASVFDRNDVMQSFKEPPSASAAPKAEIKEDTVPAFGSGFSSFGSSFDETPSSNSMFRSTSHSGFSSQSDDVFDSELPPILSSKPDKD